MLSLKHFMYIQGAHESLGLADNSTLKIQAIIFILMFTQVGYKACGREGVSNGLSALFVDE